MQISLDDLRKQIFAGEDGTHQFKENITNPESLAAEIVAFSNSEGGYIYIGISDQGEIKGLSQTDIRRINQLIANTAINNVKKPVNVKTQNVVFEDNKVIIVLYVPKGNDKPYFDKNGIIWFKVGSDKRRICSKEELRRIFQESHQFHADEMPTKAGLESLDKLLFRDFLEKTYKYEFPDSPEEQIRLLKNLNLATQDGKLNLACVLMFALHPERIVSQFGVKAIRYPGNKIHTDQYIDSEDFSGTIEKVYQDCYAFIMRNLHKIQDGQGINSPGIPEIHPVVLEETLVNALIHRDYLIDSQIRIFIYDDRVEIISPGHLPNNLTTEKIKSGNVVLRNPILASYVAKGILPYHGLGTGIIRSLDACPDIILDDDRDGDHFTVIIPRRNAERLASLTDWEKDISRAEKPASMSEEKFRLSEESSEKGTLGSEIGSEKGALGSEIGSEKGTLGSEIGSEKGALGSEVGSEKGTLGSEKGSEKGTEGSEIGIGSSEKILEIIRKDPTSSARDIANQLQISSRAVEKHLASLRQKGAIYRIGPARGGSWGLR